MQADLEGLKGSYGRLFLFCMTIIPVCVLIVGLAITYTYNSSTAADAKVEKSEGAILTQQAEDRKAAEGRSAGFRKRHNDAAQQRAEARVESAAGDSAIYGKIGEVLKGQTDILLELRRQDR